MRTVLAKTLVTGLLVAAPAMMLAATPASTLRNQAPAHKAQAVSAKQPAAKVPVAKDKSKTHAAAATHSTSGVVSSVNDTSLVITRRKANKPVEMTFSLEPSTQREGKLDVGSKVSVRYRNDGSTHVATAVKAQAAKGKG